MTNAQTEARALWLAATREEICNDGDAISVIAAALAAKNAELAAVRSERDTIVTAAVNRGLTLEAELAELREADGNFWEAIARAERAEAQLAEARKALNAGEALSRQLHAVIDRLNGQAYSSTLSALNYFDAARRAREQGGENG